METTKINKTYLMWVGKVHYPTIEDYVNEANELGVSKRAPGLEVAANIAQPGNIVFVAHDEGEYEECHACVGAIECPDCRKRRTIANRAESQVNELLELAKNAKNEQERQKIMKKVETQRARIAKVFKERASCSCAGTNELIGVGTGGMVTFANGATWDYRRYNYHLHQPEVWAPDREGGVVRNDMCETCGGTGRLPKGKVFGFFIPERVEYVETGAEDGKMLERLAKAGASTLSPDKMAFDVARGCGKRKPGGSYLVSSAGSTAKHTAAYKRMIEAGAIPANVEVEIKGGFVQFLAPVDINEKRFRGIKSWTMTADAEEEAEMALEAME